MLSRRLRVFPLVYHGGFVLQKRRIKSRDPVFNSAIISLFDAYLHGVDSGIGSGS